MWWWFSFFFGAFGCVLLTVSLPYVLGYFWTKGAYAAERDEQLRQEREFDLKHGLID